VHFSEQVYTGAAIDGVRFTSRVSAVEGAVHTQTGLFGCLLRMPGHGTNGEFSWGRW